MRHPHLWMGLLLWSVFSQAHAAWTVNMAPGAPFQLQADPPNASWPRLVTAVAPVKFWAELGREGFADEVRILPGQAAYQADWPLISVGMGPEKHTAYAMQWFAMALALLGLYFYFGWHNAQEKRHGNSHDLRHLLKLSHIG